MAVIMGMHVHESGRHGQAVRIDFLASRRGDRTNFGDDAVAHADIGGIGRCARAIHDRPAADYDVELIVHVSPLRFTAIWSHS